jgi:ATP-dependent metalloprotease
MNTRYLQSFSEQRLLALESRANEETDNAYVQASYLEAALEIDPKYVIKRVESGQYAVNDDVRYIYKKALEKIEEESPSTIRVTSKDNEVWISGASKDKEIKIPLEIKLKEKTGFLKELWYVARFILLAFFIAVLISSVFSAQIRGGTQHMVKEFMPDATDQKYKFDDVQGIDEAKQEVREVVEFLKNPKRFQTLGAKLPKGVLLVGPPGTGKTLLARAIAGEADVPFFFASGSEFDEMFVGVGAARMRKLFEQARRHKPCVVFIDELDAVGGARVATAVHPYSRMTLNQLLVELDGYKELEGVIIIGATNFPESLDKALIRPGRFDSTVTITLPDVKARHDILKVHSAKVKLDPDVDLEIIARGTSGFSGADLANMINQAALKGSADRHDFVMMEDLEYAKDKIIMGPERKSAVIEQKNREIVAYHEGGHAIVALYTPGALPIHKATIVPRGPALGMVVQLPEKDELSWSKKQLLARLDVAMGGRVAEEMIFGKDNITSGASSDVQSATKIARAMVTKYGMSEVVGPIAVGDNDKLSPETSLQIENEIRTLLKESYERARNILTTHSKEHRRLAEALLKYETLQLDEIKVVVDGKSLKRKL